MPRTIVQAVINNLLSAGANQGQLDAAFTAADPVNFNYFTASGRDILTIFNADIASVASITNVALANNLVTISALNRFVAGQQVLIASLVTATFLNAQTLTILAATATTFTASFSHSDYVSAADTGTATAAGATHHFTIHSAPDPQGRTADVTNYIVLPGHFASVTISSVALFTQNDGTIWIDADSAAIQWLLTR